MGSQEALIPTETSLQGPVGSYREIFVFSKSSLAEQTTGASLQLSDVSFYLQKESFIDLDLDKDDLGGPLSWLEAMDDTQVTHYKLYLGEGCVENISLPTVASTQQAVTASNTALS